MVALKEAMVLLHLLLSATTAHAESGELIITVIDLEQRCDSSARISLKIRFHLASEILSTLANNVDYIKTNINRSDYRLDQLLPNDYVRYMFDKTASVADTYTTFFVFSASARPVRWLAPAVSLRRAPQHQRPLQQ